MPDDQNPTTDPATGQDDQQVTQPSALPEDNGTPYQPADDVDDTVLGDAHQSTDYKSDIDSDELYNDGPAAAADAGEPRNPDIAGYTPPAPAEDGQEA